jgi:acyl carrier protein
MTEDELFAELKPLLKRHKQLKMEVAAITPETRIDQIGFDSLSILEFIYDVEDRFQIETQLADLVAMTQVRELVGYLHSKLGS